MGKSNTEAINTPNTPDPEYVLGRSTAEHERLMLQSSFLEPATDRLFHAAGIGPGMRVLDVGSGIGDVAFLAARLVGPTGSVVGVDLDANALAFARSRAAEMKLTNVTFVHGDVRDVALDGAFDAAVGRLVLLYIADPIEALRVIAAKVRRGGVLAFHEWAQKTMALQPRADLPLSTQVGKWLASGFNTAGIDTDVGAKLFKYMKSAGLEPAPMPLAEAIFHNDPDKFVSLRIKSLQSMLPAIIRNGVATEAEIDIDTLAQRLRDEIFAANANRPYMTLFGQWARKP